LVAGDVVDGELGDSAEWLGVEQDDDSGDAGPQREVVTGEQAAEQGHALALGQASGAGDDGCRQPQRWGEFAGHAPEQETAQAVSIMLVVFGVPGVDVGLLAGSQGVLVLREPVEEQRGLGDLFTGVSSAGRGDRFVRGAGSKSGQDVPGGEPLDELTVMGVGDGVEVGDEPAFEQADLLIDAW
jgi:hypothetical protein